MTKSEYIRARIQPLIRMVKPLVHEEERDGVEIKIEIWVLRLLTDVEQLSVISLEELNGDDIPYIEKL